VFDRRLTLSDALDEVVDVDTLLADYPPTYMVKGMFCSRVVDMLGADGMRALMPRLIAPPRGGHYVAFKDYPQVDYTRLVMSAAAVCFPNLASSEAARRVAREDFAAFATSMIGKVMLSLIGDAHTALMNMPVGYERITSGVRVGVESLDARTVRLTCEQYYGVPSYFLGQVEGIVAALGAKPSIVAQRLGPHALQLEVSH
jgi:uncharacterized protein (TIGR02265 family)